MKSTAYHFNGRVVNWHGHLSFALLAPLVLAASVLFLLSCGPIRPPADAYQDANTLLAQMEQKRAPIQSFRIAGSIDHVSDQRVRGKTYIFSKLPDNLRIDILSPFGNTLSVLTADKTKFGLSDYKSGKFFSGAPKPCNVARFIGIPLFPKEVITILIGQIPLIAGDAKISWHEDGHYIVTITNGNMEQILHIGPDKKTLPLRRAILKENDQIYFDVSYAAWKMTEEIYIPYEIHVKMPKENAELFVQYESDGVELNVSLPANAWEQTMPNGAKRQPLECD